MPIIFDNIGHLVSTESEEELHCFARRIKLARSWYQTHTKHPHYDLTTKNARIRAELAGAIKVNSKDLIELAWWTRNEKTPK